MSGILDARKCDDERLGQEPNGAEFFTARLGVGSRGDEDNWNGGHGVIGSQRFDELQPGRSITQMEPHQLAHALVVVHDEDFGGHQPSGICGD